MPTLFCDLRRYSSTSEEDEAVIADSSAKPRKRVAARLIRIEKAILNREFVSCVRSARLCGHIMAELSLNNGIRIRYSYVGSGGGVMGMHVKCGAAVRGHACKWRAIVAETRWRTPIN